MKDTASSLKTQKAEGEAEAKIQTDANRALAKIKQNKAQSQAFDAAIKAKDTARVRQILIENGVNAGPVMIQSVDTCFETRSGGQIHHWCITYGSNHVYIKD